MMRDFNWNDKLWAVIKEDGSFAGVPCRSFEEARELANQHEGSHVYNLSIDYNYDPEEYYYDKSDSDSNIENYYYNKCDNDWAIKALHELFN